MGKKEESSFMGGVGGTMAGKGANGLLMGKGLAGQEGLPVFESIFHACIVATGYEADVAIGNALIDAYNKYGSWKDACTIFEKIGQRNVVSWNAMLSAYSQHGHGGMVMGRGRKL